MIGLWEKNEHCGATAHANNNHHCVHCVPTQKKNNCNNSSAFPFSYIFIKMCLFDSHNSPIMNRDLILLFYLKSNNVQKDLISFHPSSEAMVYSDKP